MRQRISIFITMLIILISACSNIDKRVDNSDLEKRSDTIQSNSQKDTIRYIDIDHDLKGNLLGCSDSIKRHINKVFVLADTISTLYAIEINEEKSSFLRYRKNDKWLIIDTLEKETVLFIRLDCISEFPIFEITDFNKDGYPDLVAKLWTNCNGNIWTKLFLFNPQTNLLQLIKSAEQNGIWAAPEYDSKDRTIYCQEVSGAFGISYTSKYKLKGINVIPIEKEIDDASSMKEVITTHFKGKNGKWKKDWQR